MSDLRPIDTSPLSRAVTPPESLGAAPVLDWIAIENLRLDDAYQRPLKPSNWVAIRKIAENFSWSRFQPIVVSPLEGGHFAVVDGQHRTHAAKLVGIESVPAMSCHLTRAEQASAFSWINGNTTAISTFHVYKAALAAREAWAMDCMAAVDAAACRMMTYNRSTKEKRGGEIYSISLIREHVDAGRTATVTAGLRALRLGAEADDPLAYSHTFLRPWLMVIAELDLAGEPEILSGFLKRHSVHDILHRVDRLQSNPDYARTTRLKLLTSSLRVLLRDHIAKATPPAEATGT